MRRLALAVGGLLLLWQATNNWLFYTKVDAVVESNEEVCQAVDATSKDEWKSCLAARAESGPRGAFVGQRLRVRYTSPADGREHVSNVVVHGGSAALEATRLRAGDRWKILARRDRVEDVKAD